MKKTAAFIISLLAFVCGSLALSAETTVSLDSRNPSPEGLRFNDVIKALEAVNRLASEGVGSVTLEVAPGVYWLDNPDDPAVRKMPDNSIPYAFTIACDTLRIIATDGDPLNTVFAVDRGQTRGALGNFTMLHFKGFSLTVEGMTFGNYCNVDLVYPADHSLDRQRRCDPIVQAQLGICDNTDRFFASNCRFISRLNLCPFVGARRSLYRDCYFECTDDALTGSAVYLGCRFTFFSSKPFYNTAKTGAVFLDCDIELRGKGPQYLTKVPGMVTLVDTRFTSPANPSIEIRWTRDAAPVVSYQSGVSLNSSPYVIDADRPFMSALLGSSRALEAYKITLGDSTLYNIPNLLVGDDGWDPLGMLPAVKALEKTCGRPLTGLPVRLDIADSHIALAARDDSAPLQPRFLRWGAYPLGEEELKKLFPMTIAYTAPDVVNLEKLPAWGEAEAVSHNNMSREAKGFIVGRTSYGLQGATSLSVAPYLKNAPTFASRPSLGLSRGEVRVDYSLADASDDACHFEWYSCAGADWSDSIPLRHGNGRAFSAYTPRGADRGRYIGVYIIPKASDSRPGEAVRFITERPVATKHVKLSDLRKESSYITDFSDVCVRTQPKRLAGSWSFDSFKPADTAPYAWEPDKEHSWYYGRATDASTGTGLVQWTRGARAFYTPFRSDCRDMSARLVLEPCKSAGQGFGSATGQYFDIYIKYNPETRSGYGLRIERTVDYDRAVVFTLMRFDGDKATPLSAPQASTCYRTPCTVNLSIRDGSLRAEASTTAPSETAPALPGSPLPEVSLSAEVPDEKGPAVFGLQHTGTTGASATLISKVELDWD